MAGFDYQETPHPGGLDRSLLIGVPVIDEEHDELVKQLDNLVGDPHADHHTERFSDILSRLGRQISSHFNHEEEIFKSFGMPEGLVLNHIQAHTEILDQYAHLNLDLMQGKTFSRADLLQMVKRWIIDHVAHHDLLIKDYLPANNNART